MTLVGGLLFLAFAYFAVGQAAFLRGGTQGAADAAALAAAQDARDQLISEVLQAIDEPEFIEEILSRRDFSVADSCGRSGYFAERNGATLESCSWGAGRFTVAVESSDSVGQSVVPGTSEQRAVARAAAALQVDCTFVGAEDSEVLRFDCEDGIVEIKIESPSLDGGFDEIFTVRLVGVGQ